MVVMPLMKKGPHSRTRHLLATAKNRKRLRAVIQEMKAGKVVAPKEFNSRVDR